MARTILVTSGKGGVGKTTVCAGRTEFPHLAQGDLSRQNYSCRRTRHYQQGYSERLFQAPYERDRKDGKRRGKSSDLIICFYSPPYYINIEESKL